MKPLFFCLAMVTAMAWGEGPYQVITSTDDGLQTFVIFKVIDKTTQFKDISNSDYRIVCDPKKYDCSPIYDLAAALNSFHEKRIRSQGCKDPNTVITCVGTDCVSCTEDSK